MTKRLRRPSLRLNRSAPRHKADQADSDALEPPNVHPDREDPPVSDTVQLVAFDMKWFRRGVVSLLIILTIYSGGLWILRVTGHFLFLILLAWLIAIAMEPSIRFFERRGLRRGMGTGITMFAGTLVTALVFVMLGGVLSAQSVNLVESFPAIVTDVVAWLNESFDLDLNAASITDKLRLDATTVASLATNFAGGIVGVLGAALAILFESLTVLVFAFFFAADGPKLRRTIAARLPHRKQHILITVWDISIAKTGGFFVSKVILSGISAVAHAAFFFAIDLPFWLPMGIFAGLAGQLIPAVGTYFGIIVPVLVGVFDSPFNALWIVAFATVYQQIENYVLMPRISRATMELHPAVALVSVFIGAVIWGPIGAIIGIPLAAAIIAVLETYGRRYELVTEMQNGYQGSEETPADEAREQALLHATAAVGKHEAIS